MSDVDAWMAKYENPMKPVVEAVRAVILGADPRMGECIKWSAPTFTFGGNLASFNPRSKKHASLLFHTGASIPGDFPHLTGSGEVARTMSFADLAEVEARRAELEAIVRAWCALKG
ncbi:MAG: DUF1801 domain-containing protein [Myxococcales bacterium]|nr:DUF1801 domain-containing protein [Myxococcales bacterium]